MYRSRGDAMAKDEKLSKVPAPDFTKAGKGPRPQGQGKPAEQLPKPPDKKPTK